MPSIEDEAIIVALRRHTLLPLEDNPPPDAILIALLSAASRQWPLPEVDGDKPARKPFMSHPIGYFHIDIPNVQTGQRKRHLFVAIDRTSRFVFVQLVDKASRVTASAFLTAYPVGG